MSVYIELWFPQYSGEIGISCWLVQVLKLNENVSNKRTILTVWIKIVLLKLISLVTVPGFAL